MYRTLTNRELSPNLLRYKPCGIIMGHTGAGKTTLSNKICGTAHESGAAKGSVTQYLYRNDVRCGAYSFSLIDTPGTDSSTDTYKHAFLLRTALTATLTNTIFLLIKYTNRFDKLVDNYFELLQPILKYSGKIAVLISHMDVSKNKEENFKEICELFATECPDVTNILFFSDRSPDQEICLFMFSCLSSMKSEMLQISDEDFHLNFNICQLRNQLKAAFSRYQRNTELMVNDYAALIQETAGELVDDRDEMLHMLIVEFRNETEGLFDTFIKKHGDAMNDLEYYVFAIKMQKENVRICDEFSHKAAQLMSYNLYDNKDIRNLIKQCPHCHLIWYKTEGCDGQTNCGTRVSKYFDECNTPTSLFKYVMTFFQGKRKIARNKRKDRAMLSLGRNQPHSGGVGSGNRLVWGQLPKLDDEIILELFKAKTIAEAVELIKSQGFAEARAEFVSKIDKSFKL